MVVNNIFEKEQEIQQGIENGEIKEQETEEIQKEENLEQDDDNQIEEQEKQDVSNNDIGIEEENATQDETDTEETDKEQTDKNDEEDDEESDEEDEGEKQNFDYTVDINGQKEELPEYLRAGIKDEETLQEVKDLYVKGKTYDIVEQEYKTLYDNHLQTKSVLNDISDRLNIADKLIEKGDSLSALRMLNIPDEVILNSSQILLADEQTKKIYEQYSQTLQKEIIASMEAEKKAKQLEQQQLQLAQQQLNVAMAHPEVQKVAQLYNEFKKDNNAFLNAVIAYGQMKEQMGIQITIEDAIQQVMNEVKPLIELYAKQKNNGEDKDNIKKRLPRRTEAKKRLKTKSGRNTGKKAYKTIFDIEEDLDL